jgi:hypothetical protein
MGWEGGSVRAEPETETRTFCLKDSGIGRGRELGRRAADQPCAQEGDAGAGGGLWTAVWACYSFRWCVFALGSLGSAAGGLECWATPDCLCKCVFVCV